MGRMRVMQGGISPVILRCLICSCYGGVQRSSRIDMQEKGRRMLLMPGILKMRLIRHLNSARNCARTILTSTAI